MKVKSLISFFLPAIICLLISYLLDKKYFFSSPAYLMPLFFGIVLGSFNYKFYRYKIYINRTIQVILISIIISFLSFVFASFSFPLVANVLAFIFEKFSINFGKEAIARLSIFFATYLVAPLSILLTFKVIFKYPKTKLTKALIIVSLMLFVLLGHLSYLENELSLLWMPLMAISLQLILYQKELVALLKSKIR